MIGLVVLIGLERLANLPLLLLINVVTHKNMQFSPDVIYINITSEFTLGKCTIGGFHNCCQARESEMITDPDHQNTFLGSFDCIYIFTR